MKLAVSETLCGACSSTILGSYARILLHSHVKLHGSARRWSEGVHPFRVPVTFVSAPASWRIKSLFCTQPYELSGPTWPASKDCFDLCNIESILFLSGENRIY